VLSWRLVGTLFTEPSRVPIYTSVHSFLCGIRGIIGPFISLSIYEVLSAQYVARISMGGMALSILILIPIIPALERRRKKIMKNSD